MTPEVLYLPGFLGRAEADRLLAVLLAPPVPHGGFVCVRGAPEHHRLRPDVGPDTRHGRIRHGSMGDDTGRALEILRRTFN